MLGLRAVDEDEPAPVAAEATPAPAGGSWAERADELCLTGIRDVRNIVARQPVGPARRTRAAAALLPRDDEDRGQLVEGLRELPVTADRAKVDEAIDRLEQEFERDVLAGNALQRKFDLAALRSRITQYEGAAARLRTLFGSLGAAGCAAYFDPASYG